MEFSSKISMGTLYNGLMSYILIPTGDIKKCLGILEKGFKVTSDPRLSEALHRVKNGLPILLDSQEPMESQDGQLNLLLFQFMYDYNDK